ncbi:FCD domain-containing protein [Nocardia sp. NPDC005366]|uniref:FadR/GntR family transcriptional regulator n=1 Tax=Nocardia sp. NPDC005366 TaxID=3156878 RepID=UPI0033BA3C5A
MTTEMRATPGAGGGWATLNSRGQPHESKLARRVARQLEDDIVRDGWRVGSIYASGTELQERYDVSRAVIREAIRLVEHHGVAKMLRGPYGGLMLRAPDAAPLTAAVVIYLEYVGATVEDVLAVRLLLEPVAARLAAQRLAEDQISTLRRAIVEERSQGDIDASTRDHLHTMLGRLSGNPALGIFIDVLSQLTTRYAKAPQEPGEDEARQLSAASDHAHERIVEAVVAGDTFAAERRIVRHLTTMRTWLLSTRQEPIARRSSPVTVATEIENIEEKRAETVARQLMAEIVASDVAPGEIYGSESELQARFEVSRAVFREAIRLLEYHSVARMRRGQFGGLVVSEPDPAACVDAMSIYLEYEEVQAEQLRQVREIIELGALDLVIARSDHPDLASALQLAHRVHPGADRDDIAPLSADFHLTLANLSGNPVLSLLLRILLAVWSRHSEQSARRRTHDHAADSVSRAHGSIVDAVVAGDAALARRRMLKHLAALDQWWE